MGAGLYRYGSDPEDRDAETPVDVHNHALAALRYIANRLDARKMARLRKLEPAAEAPATTPTGHGPAQWWQDMMREELWTRIC